MDEKGRRRFHGAFTGGFSAGYFNTVGSKEGWQPKQFHSSRFNRNATVRQQEAEHFMDEEDLAEFGIAPKKFAVASKLGALDKNKPSDENLDIHNYLDRFFALKDETIGTKLLSVFGFSESDDSQSSKLAPKKVYTVSLPQGLIKPSQIAKNFDELDNFDNIEIKIKYKDDNYGLGFRNDSKTQSNHKSSELSFETEMAGSDGDDISIYEPNISSSSYNFYDSSNKTSIEQSMEAKMQRLAFVKDPEIYNEEYLPPLNVPKDFK